MGSKTRHRTRAATARYNEAVEEVGMVQTARREKLERLIKEQGVKPVDDPEKLVGWWPGKKQDAATIVATIRALRDA